MARKIYLTSFKGGVGVSTCAVGLGAALATLGERTLIVDGDVVCGSAVLIGDCRDLQVYTLGDYEKGACRAKQTLIFHPHDSNLCFMPSLGLSDPKVAAQAVGDVDGLFDFILLDKIAPETCNEAIIVTEPFTPSVKSADCCRSTLIDGGIKEISLIVNKINGGQILNGEVMTAHEIAALLHLPLKAVIPEDLTLPAGSWKQPTVKAFKTAAETVSGKREGYCNVLKGYGGLNGIIKRKLRAKL
jgi:septum site-determining protein MinD